MGDWSAVSVVAAFLLPKPGLATAMFVCMAVLAIAAGWVVFRAGRSELKKLTEAVDKLSSKGHPDPVLWLSSRAEYHEAVTALRRADSIPSVFVSLGILGTFLGLGLAIQGAAAGMSAGSGEAGEILSQLRELLASVAFKFQTSVWGLLWALVFQSLGASLHARFDDLNAAAQAKMARENAVVTASVSATVEKQFSGIKASADKMERGASNLQQSVDEFSSNVAVFGDSVGTALSKIGEATEDLGQLGDSVKEALSAISNAMMKELNPALAGVSEAVAKSVEIAAKGNAIASTAKTQSEMLEESVSNLAKVLNALNTELREHRKANGELILVIGEQRKHLGVPGLSLTPSASGES